MENKDLSVIIPMYNCAKVITRCLDSIDYQEAEIIVVDDGSKDNGAEVVTQYLQTRPNVILLKKENGGVSSARNIGLDHAQGKYIMFIDADDYVGKDGIETMLKLALQEDADVLKYASLYLNDNSPEDHTSLKNTSFSIRRIAGKAEALRHYDISDYVIWDGMFKRSLIEDNHIRFDEELHLREDDVFMGKVYCMSTKVVSTDFPLYRYIMASTFSSTHNQTQERNRILVNSNLLAMKIRSSYIRQHLPNESFPLERYKYMRWVCSARQAIAAGYTYQEYIDLLKQYKEIGVYPVCYKWIKVAGYEYFSCAYFKRIRKTFFLNHPKITWTIIKIVKSFSNKIFHKKKM